MNKDIKKLSKIMKALSNENRLQLYLQIWSQEKLAVPKSECFISDIAAKFNIGAPTISHHIKELEAADLIYTNKIGKQVTASINKETKKYLIAAFSV
jgi:ArsR family transcriptional regulator, arsenate/arsenite/antimonite-responsive transcriptional repressor